jgi:hypothetical protein
LLGIHDNQCILEDITTQSQRKGSKRADMVIVDKRDRNKVLLIIEFKLDRNIPFNQKRNKKNYFGAVEQLQTYCQLKKSPYGIILTEKICGINSFSYEDDQVDRKMIKELPNIFSPKFEEIKKHISKKTRKILPYLLGVILLSILVYVGITAYYKNACDIKGNVSALEDGSTNRWYHTKRSPWYEKTTIEKDKGERWFCSEEQAVEAGWMKFYDQEEWDKKNPRDCDIKGVTDAQYDKKTGEESIIKVYYTPNDLSYAKKILYETRGDRMFCSEREAVKNGFRRAFDDE